MSIFKINALFVNFLHSCESYQETKLLHYMQNLIVQLK